MFPLRHLRLAAAALLVTALAGCQPPAEAPPKTPAPADTEASDDSHTLTVVSWNIEWFPGGQPNASASAAHLQMAGARKALARLQPDMLLAQEIRGWKPFAQLVHGENDLKPVVISGFPPGGSGIPPQNVAIASNLIANSAWSEEWVDGGQYDPPRGFAFAALELPNRFLLVYSVHLKSNRGDPTRNFGTRMESAKQFLAHVARMKKVYGKIKPVGVLVAGDFNTSLDDGRFVDDHTLTMLTDAGFHWAYEGVPFADRVSLPARRLSGYPDATFDHILTWGLGKPKARTIRVPNVSDHMPVLMELRVDDLPAKPKD